jgi:hypothetical protein
MINQGSIASERLDIAAQTLAFIRSIDSGHVWGALTAINVLSPLLLPSTFAPTDHQRRQAELICSALASFEQHLTDALALWISADEIREATAAIASMLREPSAIDGRQQARAAILQGALAVLLNREALSGVAVHMPEAALAHFMQSMDQPNHGRRPFVIH